MIKAIVFDIGGVLVELDARRCIRNFKEKCGFDKIVDFLDTCHQGGMIGALEAGEITEEQFHDECRKYCRPGVTDSMIDECFCSLIDSEMDPAKAACLKELSGKYDLFLLSNNNHITMRHIAAVMERAGIPMDGTFKDVFVSCDLKMSKPSPEIFREVIRRSGHDRSEILFVDDSPRNVRAGRERGIAAALYVCGTDLKATLEPFLK